MTYKINFNKILISQVGEDGVIFDLENNSYMSLNETFFKILKGIEAGDIQAQIIQNLCEEYEVSTEECTVEVQHAIQQLLQKNYIVG
jgi:Coenzyme PQQ synthesis protein D (PqqD)